MTVRNRRRRGLRSSAALLLVLQALGPGAVSVAHATERLTAPAGWEAHHTAACAVLHDAARCAVCHYAGARFVATSTVRPAAPVPCHPNPLAADVHGRRAALLSQAARPRAPPTFIS
ncbi:MAG: hypothetical protein DMD57_12270 [Gemmatimonadetes bacterium]|nr:MAG: hypothetical protein DMD57_12270 [Gemmatimonadota bacterium]